MKESLKIFGYYALFILWIFTLKAQDFNFEGNVHAEKPYLFISLGYNCWVAEALRRYGLRDSAFPFDWMFSIDHDGFIRCLNEDFKHFTNQNFILGDGQEAPAVKNSRYGIVFMHDWPFPDSRTDDARHKEHMRVIKNKYLRRIERFRDLRNYSGKVFFIRFLSTYPEIVAEFGWNNKKAQELKDTLDKFFPSLDFTLVIPSCSHPDIPEVGVIKGVMEFKIKNLTDYEEYKDMFSTLLKMVS